ncbi:CRISPR-associated endonuclease Cas1 [Thiolapillus sp.]|uniref:CRISPR-associated endonuclease Cas1 n=1 Tax=Thiolapillus sp. TaxID=2017437 RepID=UPI0025EBFCBD
MRGLEGDAARVYFGCFNDMLRPSLTDVFQFRTRNRRPPTLPAMESEAKAGSPQ